MKRFRIICCWLLIAIFALTGCNAGDDELKGQAGADQLRLNLLDDSQALDPSQVSSPLLEDPLITDLLFLSLTDIDPQSGQVVPALAHSWEVDESKTKWTFHLRDDIYWVAKNDSGEIEEEQLVNAFDFPAEGFAGILFNLRPAQSWRASYQIKKIEVLDAYTLEFILNEPVPDFDQFASLIYPVLEGHVDDWTAMEILFTTSPYMIDGPWEHNENITLTKIQLEQGDWIIYDLASFPSILISWEDQEAALQKFQENDLDTVEISGFEIAEELGLNPIIVPGFLSDRYFLVAPEKQADFESPAKMWMAGMQAGRYEELQTKAQGHINKATNQLEVHNCEEGLPEARKALEKSNSLVAAFPDYADAYYCRAKANILLEELAPAVEDFEKALALGLDDEKRGEVQEKLAELKLRVEAEPCDVSLLRFNQGEGEEGHPLLFGSDRCVDVTTELKFSWFINDACATTIVVKYFRDDVLQCYHYIHPNPDIEWYGSMYYEDDGSDLDKGFLEIQTWDGLKELSSMMCLIE